jgi:hypothetical protein
VFQLPSIDPLLHPTRRSSDWSKPASSVPDSDADLVCGPAVGDSDEGGVGVFNIFQPCANRFFWFRGNILFDEIKQLIYREEYCGS